MAKPTKQDAQLDAYYQTLDELAQQYATHEGAVSSAFQTLLADTARRHHWTLIPQLTAEGIRPDGTLKDPLGLVRGHWEAKDTNDVLDVEISKKIQKGYPLANIIFEDTREAFYGGPQIVDSSGAWICYGPPPLGGPPVPAR